MKLIQQSIFKFFVGACLVLIGLGWANAGGGIGGSGRTAYGSITAFGSIFVNGIEYSTSTANIILNGNANQPESALKLGMAVRVEGSINPDGKTGTATIVEFNGDVEGAIDAAPVITGTRGTFKIYGFVVKTDSKTVYDNVSGLAALQPADIVEVSGFFNANDGSFSATRVEKQVAFRKVELRGNISNVTATTFKLGPSLTVNYSAAQLRNIPRGGLVNGLFVEVKATTPPASNVLAATRVSVESSVLASANVAFGLVQGVAANVSRSSAQTATLAKAAGDISLVMGNQPILTNAQTVFIGAPERALTNGATAIANGPVVNGVMTAETITIVVPGMAVLGADVSGDGKSDLLLRDAGGVTNVYLMDGTSVTSAATLLSSGSAWSITHIGDFNGDSRSDLLFRNSVDGTVLVFVMNGLTVQSSVTLLGAGSPWIPVQVADFNGDGKSDILWRNSADGSHVIWLMNGTAIIGGGLILGGGPWVATHTADFNNDGKADILWRNTSDGSVAIWMMNGTSVTSGGVILGAGPWIVTHVGDFNGDRNADILWRNSSDGSVAMWMMNGGTPIGGGALLGTSPWVVTHVGDLDGDGNADILLRSSVDGTVAGWLMNGANVRSNVTLLGPNTGYAAQTLLDFNGDGKADIIWRNINGALVTWIMNGLGLTSAKVLTGPGTFQVSPAR
jgi:Domain of unknown function (DUF5666)/FG-GAP-like repeat